MKSRPVPTGPVGATRNDGGLAFKSAYMYVEIQDVCYNSWYQS